MFIHDFSPVLVELGPFEIRYYGLVYVFGFLFAYWLLYRAADSDSIEGLERDLVDDLMFWLMIGVVVGGRLGYFLFYQPEFFWTNPLEILMIWHGGMSFHGGFLGLVISALWFLKDSEVSFYDVADLMAFPAAVTLGLGRLANFINAEIVGTKADASWCVKFPDYESCRHPVQVYLALKNFAVAGLLWFLDREEREPGFIGWSFVLWYGVGRFIIDFWRLEPRFLGISMGQYLSLAMVLVGGYMVWRKS